MLKFFAAEDGKLTAKKVGTATVKVSYTVTEGVTENKSFTVTVEKVVETIDTAVAYFSALDGKDKTLDNPVNMFALFDGVTFTAKQTYNGTDYDLTVDGVNKKLTRRVLCERLARTQNPVIADLRAASKGIASSEDAF